MEMNTYVDRARRDDDFVRETLRVAQMLLLNGERDAADVLLEVLAHGAPQTELAIEDAAGLLGVSRTHIEELMKHGLLASDRTDQRRLLIGDVVRYRKARIA